MLYLTLFDDDIEDNTSQEGILLVNNEMFTKTRAFFQGNSQVVWFSFCASNEVFCGGSVSNLSGNGVTYVNRSVDGVIQSIIK